MTKNNSLESRLIPYDKADANITRLGKGSVRIEYKGKLYLMEQEPSSCIPGTEIYPYYALDNKGDKKEIADYDTFMMLYIIYQRFLEAEAKDAK